MRTICERLQRHLNLPSRHAAMKPLVTVRMKRQRLMFAHKYKDWTPEQWMKVCFSDESTFRCIRMCARRVRRPEGSNRYHPRYTAKTVKHPASVMVWGIFSGENGAGDLFFLPKNTTMRAENYLDVLKDHMHHFFDTHQPGGVFMHDGAPCHKAKLVTEFLEEYHITVLEWPGNSPDLNPIENAWAHIKEQLSTVQTNSVPRLQEAITQTWREIGPGYFETLARSMPQRLQDVIDLRGDITKY